MIVPVWSWIRSRWTRMVDDLRRSRLERERERLAWQAGRRACQAYRDEQRWRWDETSRQIDENLARSQARRDVREKRLAEDDDKPTIH
jgi:hypothetical protein